MSTEAQTEQRVGLHGGRLVAKRLKAHGVTKLFTLSGGHLFSIYDGCREEGIDIVDVRHEQTAVFAAEGWAKATREPGVCALTAGPGVTNGMSGMASALQNGSPLLVLGGRAPALRWGQGSLQEIDHVPFVAPLTKLARTAESTGDIPGLVDEALRVAVEAPTGPTFLDFPLDHVFMEAEVDADAPAELPDPRRRRAGRRRRDRARGRAAARRRAAGDHGRHRALLGPRRGGAAGAGRGARDPGVPERPGARLRAGRPSRSSSRARAGPALKGADVALVVGVPMDFRLGFGGSFGDETQIVVVGSAPPERPHPREVAAELFGGVPATLGALREAGAGGPDRVGLDASSSARSRTRSAPREQDDLNDERSPLHPMRLYHELAQVLDRDAVVIGDGGDFVSFAGRVIDSYEPGCWMDPGPYGCLGTGPGYALAAKLAHPERQVCLLLGDGAFGFSGPRVRHARAPRRAGGRRDGQQRHLGAREAPDGVPLRLLGGRRPPARLPLRRGRRRPGRPRRAGGATRPTCAPRWSAPSPRASPRW